MRAQRQGYFVIFDYIFYMKTKKLRLKKKIGYFRPTFAYVMSL
jgi:hypothetical protein